ncbi:AF4/FMR2 family member 1-like [Uloborus diversus]|uniref:AF4/FMR2 family member 1-like n=1 Tax=Uloborus diversus TaxID=327109 RepID=UPI002409CB87|nr:AF4/FMR2 family member 1-like [Uloborus diversus]
MSNLAGNYKISAGEVQGGVDIVREQERRARLQLLDEIREPSPQPIFGEPVKVELEDETSRRIKNTLGDFTQVLINDAKNLIGISRPNSLNSYGSAPPPRAQQAAKKPPVVNGMHKPSQMAPPKMGPDKRAPYQKSVRQEPPPASKPYYPASCPPPGQAPYGIDNSRSRDPATWDSNSKDPKRSTNPVNINVSSGSGSNVATTSNLCNSTGVVSSYGKPTTSMPSIQNGLPSTVPKYGETSSAPPPKRPILRPCMFNYPDRKTEKPIEHMEVETILREMQQAVPPPLTAIQTPRTEESGFAFFRADSKEVSVNIIRFFQVNNSTLE